MEAFHRHEGIVLPLGRASVDTDQIIPASYMKRVTKTGYEDGLFASWRQDPDFILNDDRYAHSSILVAGPDFGTGSSREHAVWALRDFGFRVVVSSAIADIFRGNAGKQGLLAATMEPKDVDQILALAHANPGVAATVDLEERSFALADFKGAIVIDDHSRHMLLEGLDDIDLTLKQEAAITEFEHGRRSWLPRTLPVR
ncbi:3-isopropylmalate dehydratase small subunit [Frondihabitans sp. 762G35]|uniref:3-isopropylmalate dehydratase small subunit n=1 Tax=Frondihabitans sp. 762G35 TaxID=1446794 RepID=UPI000D211A68|nr:3-isopropylmalate dehydratase small subunit [Frondihabitans sp. 762G35]ARC58627.1 3-isopropylmalate dehydratase small subunit [Frondihabitans sp. 762G35]